MKKKMFAVVLIVMLSCSFASAADPEAFPSKENLTGNVQVTTKDYATDITCFNRVFKCSGYNQNANPEIIVKAIKLRSANLLNDTNALGRLIADGEVTETFGKQFYFSLKEATDQILDNIYGPIADQWELGVKSTKSIRSLQDDVTNINAKVNALAKRVDTNNNFINALWMEDHGFNSITVQVCIYKLEKRVEILDLDGNILKAYFIIKDSDMGGLQTRRITKLTTLAWNSHYGEFGILHCADISAGTPVETSALVDIREVNLVVTHKHLTKSGVKTILRSRAFNVTNDEIKQMLANQ